MAQFTVRQLGFAQGAEITGLDLRQPLNDLARKELLDAWHRHLVLVFPGQDLSAAQQVAFSRNFGELEKNDALPHYRDPENDEILLVTNRQIAGKPSETRNTGRNWHTDLSYTARPAKASLLLCKEKPPVGGDTMWANQYLAYETLSAPMRAFVETLEAIHDVSLVKGIEKRDPQKVAEMKRINPPVAHPVVRTHPDTGRKALYLGRRTRSFVGYTEEESRPILDFLNAHATSDEFVYRHRWSLHDLVMWDNRCLLHVALPDFDQTKTRHMTRTSILGEPTGRVIVDDAPEKESLMQAIASVS
ncbi:MAG: TauD/TfdA dioxygenase family protein [Burkholderiales bacterium]